QTTNRFDLLNPGTNLVRRARLGRDGVACSVGERGRVGIFDLVDFRRRPNLTERQTCKLVVGKVARHLRAQGFTVFAGAGELFAYVGDALALRLRLSA